MKYLPALAYYGVRNQSCRLQQDVYRCYATAMAAQEKSRQAKRRRQGEYRQEIGAWVHISRLGMVALIGQPIPSYS
jgi:hypothetical protein